jgi:hypothetical protein
MSDQPQEAAFATVIRVLESGGDFQLGPGGAHRHLVANLRAELAHDREAREDLRRSRERADRRVERLLEQRELLVAALRLCDSAMESLAGEVVGKKAANWGLVNSAGVALNTAIDAAKE